MTGADKIREGVLNKAQAEAAQIVSEAESKAKELIEKTQFQNAQRLEQEKNKLVAEARRKASKILAQASLRTRQEILMQKNAVIKELFSGVKNRLSKNMPDTKSLLRLLEETIEAFGTEQKIRISVSPKDLKAMREIIEGSDRLQERIMEVNETNCLGGVLAETLDGMVSIDNTFDTRLEMLMPKLLPEISRELFGTEQK